MNFRNLKHVFATVFTIALAACGGGAPPTPPPVTVTIGTAGGMVNGPSGATVVIPNGALSQDTPIGIAQTDVGAPALSAGTTTFGAMFAFTPHGSSFAKPVTMTVPFDPSKVPVGTTPVLLKTNAAMNGWDVVAGATVNGNVMNGQVTGFSLAIVTLPPLERGAPVRTVYVAKLDSARNPVEPVLESDKTIQPDGKLDKPYEFGTAEFPDPSDPNDDPNVANGRVFSSANGVTYFVSNEAPHGEGSRIKYEQKQGYIKRADNAKLQLIVTKVRMEALDFNEDDLLKLCTAKKNSPERLLCEKGMLGWLEYNVDVFQGDKDAIGRRIFKGLATAHLEGWKNHWQLDATFAGSESARLFAEPLWDNSKFSLDKDVDKDGTGHHAKLELTKPLVINIDLSKITANKDPSNLVDGAFTVKATVFSDVLSKRSGENYLGAFLRDPQKVDGDVQIITEGLEPTDPSPLGPPATDPNLPPSCASLPSAGTLSFISPDYTTAESVGAAGADLLIARIGGNAGEVSATVTTSDDTAKAGTDYEPLSTTVTFKDGDDLPKYVSVPLIYSSSSEPTKSFNVSLSKPTGCGSLGLDKTVVNILDDTRSLPTPSGLDPSFGNGGKVTTDKFGGKNSAMALQKDGKIVMVGGSSTDFVLARYNADGSLDTGFGSGGKVTTDVVGSLEEHANGVAIQADGKIVVVGDTGVFTSPNKDRFSFALVRYNSDGSLDTSFGMGGKVTSGVVGQARAVALQADGKIVVVGDTLVFGRMNDFSDFVVARYNTDGSLDSSFGSNGQNFMDVGGTNQAFNVALQSDGKIVVSGSPIGVSTSDNHTDIARFTSSGNPDGSFDKDAMLQISGLRAGDGLVIQPDGKLVLVGNVETAIPPATAVQFALMRLAADGSLDNSFGSAGLVKTAFAARSDRARSVALQADGKILVAGQSNDFLFALARYNPDGTPDSSFRSDGKLTIGFGIQDGAESVALQPDGKIVLGGFSRSASSIGYALARLIP